MQQKNLVKVLLIGLLLLTMLFSVPMLAVDSQGTTDTTQVEEETTEEIQDETDGEDSTEEQVTLWEKMKEIFGLKSERDEVDDAVIEEQLTELDQAIQEMEGLTLEEKENLSVEVKTQLQESYQNHPSGKIPTGLIIKSLREKIEDDDLNIKEAGQIVSEIARNTNSGKAEEKAKGKDQKSNDAKDNRDKNRSQDHSNSSSNSSNSSNKSSGGSSKGQGK